MLETNNNSFGLNDLKQKGIELSTKAIEIFNEDAKNQNISIQVKFAGDELFTLQFNIDDLTSPDKLLNNTVASTVESLLNQIPTILTVQNKI